MKRFIYLTIIIFTYVNMFSQVKSDVQLKADVVTKLPSATNSISAEDFRDLFDMNIDSKLNIQTYDANSTVVANSDNNPIVLSILEQTMLGRSVGGVISALDTTAIRNLIFGDPTARSNYSLWSDGTEWKVSDNTFLLNRTNDIGENSIFFGGLFDAGIVRDADDENLNIYSTDTLILGISASTDIVDVEAPLRILGDSTLYLGYNKTEYIKSANHKTDNNYNVLQLNSIDGVHFPNSDTAEVVLFFGDSIECIYYHDTLVDDQALSALITANSKGFGWIMAGNNQEFAQFRFGSSGGVTLINNSTNVTNTDTDANLNIYQSSNTLRVRNRLGVTMPVTIKIEYIYVVQVD